MTNLIQNKTFGYEEGETCNRNGCDGQIEREGEGGCSCHISPPCGHCTSPYYCPECGWEETDESSATEEKEFIEYKTSDLLLDTYYRVEHGGRLSMWTKKPDGQSEHDTEFYIHTLSFVEEDSRWSCNQAPSDKKSNRSSYLDNSGKVIDDEEWFSDLEAAKKVAEEKYYKQINPFGKYKVARYFDDCFEAYVTKEISKKEAQEKAAEFNRRKRHYVSYGIVGVS